jgi:hypothetical protein
MLGQLIVVARKVRFRLPELSFFSDMIDDHIQCIMLSNESLVFVLLAHMSDNFSSSMLFE